MLGSLGYFVTDWVRVTEFALRIAWQGISMLELISVASLWNAVADASSFQVVSQFVVNISGVFVRVSSSLSS